MTQLHVHRFINQTNKKCKICKKSYSLKSNWYRNSKWYKCCSRKCADVSRRKRKLLTCTRCHNKFEVPKSRKLKWCSWKCRYPKPYPYKIGHPRRNKKCLRCKKKTSNAKYCSAKCVGLAYRGKGNPCWRNGVSKLPYDYKFSHKLKQQVRKRDKMICQLCLRRVKGKNAHCHHVDRVKLHSKLSNLILLCNPCNAKMNMVRGYKPYQKLFKGIIYAHHKKER